jgi:hypothetical protein
MKITPEMKEELERVYSQHLTPFMLEVWKNSGKAYTLRITARKGKVTGFQTQIDEPNI